MSIEQLISQISEGVDAKETFHAVIMEKISARLEESKAEVMEAAFGTPEHTAALRAKLAKGYAAMGIDPTKVKHTTHLGTKDGIKTTTKVGV
jgi:hypothetical protein